MLRMIFVLKAKAMLRKGCASFLASLVVPPPIEPKLQDIELVRDFFDIFLDELYSLPLDREIEFSINLIPRMAPISKVSYRMAPIEIKEFKDLLQELLENGFICLSVSLWCVLVLFVKKKDESW